MYCVCYTYSELKMNIPCLLCSLRFPQRIIFQNPDLAYEAIILISSNIFNIQHSIECFHCLLIHTLSWEAILILQQKSTLVHKTFEHKQFLREHNTERSYAIAIPYINEYISSIISSMVHFNSAVSNTWRVDGVGGIFHWQSIGIIIVWIIATLQYFHSVLLQDDIALYGLLSQLITINYGGVK